MQLEKGIEEEGGEGTQNRGGVHNNNIISIVVFQRSSVLLVYILYPGYRMYGYIAYPGL